MCDKCNEQVRFKHKYGRVKFWLAFPGLFGLPEWEELEKEQEQPAWQVTVFYSILFQNLN